MFGAESLERLRRRAERAAAAGDDTFAIPEAAPAAEFLVARLGPGALRSEAEGWLSGGASYHALVRLAARAVIALSDDGEAGSAVYVPKAAGEVEPLLRLWPAALAVPTPMAFEAVDLVELRAFPVHPLGLVAEPSWADGGVRSPAEFFFHDLDHARFKIREDLRVEGIEIPDAYRLGTTLDAETGQHRTILSAAESRVGSLLWGRVESRRELCARLLAFSASLAEPLRTATELLLFEILCEKSLPLDEDVLVHELRSGAHVIKARRKQASGFYGDYASGPAVMAALEEACGVLGESL